MPKDPPRARAVASWVVAVGVVVALVAVLALTWGPTSAWVAGVRAPCSVVVDGEPVPLDQARARAATAAAARTLPGEVANVTGEGIPGGVVDAILTARHDTALTCRTTEADVAAEGPTDSGLTPRAAAVLEQMRTDFGDLPVGGFAPGGVDSGHGERSTHYDGRAVDIFFRPVTEENLDRGWVLSQWLVARADELAVQFVIFDDHVWGVRRSAGGWRAYQAPGGSDDPVLRHLDHVHVDVLRGV